MSGLVYPASLPGLTFDSTRTPSFKTGIQEALSGKESRIQYQQYPRLTFELQYELLRDYTTPSDLKALVGLFTACSGQYDSFLYSDPAFNTVANMQFAVTDGTTAAFQLTATYQNNGGPGGAEIIQNLTGGLQMVIQRYGTLFEYPLPASRTQFVLHSQDFTNASWGKSNLTPLTAAQAAPDGTFTANVFNDTTTSSVTHALSQGLPTATAAGIYTFSIFNYNGVIGESSFIQIQLADVTSGSFATAIFNHATGALVTSSFSGTAFSNLQTSSQSNGGAWNRLSVTITTTGGAGGLNVFVVPQVVAGTNAYAGTVGAAAMALWGAQVENAEVFPAPASAIASPTMYIPSVAAVVTQQDWVGIGPTGIMFFNLANFASIPGIKLLWSGSFFYRCRFDTDAMTVTQFMKDFWSNMKVTLKSIKL